jgi:hypothetical protein
MYRIKWGGNRKEQTALGAVCSDVAKTAGVKERQTRKYKSVEEKLDSLYNFK